MSAAAVLPAFAADAKPRTYERVLLVDERGEPLRASSLAPLTNYVFNYPYEATPVFLLDLGKPVPPQSLATRDHETYAWPGGTGTRRSIVAYSAICAHRLVYPTRDVSFISFRKTRARKGVQDEVIHCCSENSQYDPAHGARVLAGPADQPLCAVLLQHEPERDTLTAYGTLGGELFDEFFRRYEARLALESGPRARQAARQRAVVRELTRYCRNAVQC